MSFEPLEIQHLRHALHVSETLATARLKEREDYQRIAYEHGEEIKRLKKQLGISTDQRTPTSNDQVQDLKEELGHYKSATEYWHSAVGLDAKFFMEQTEVKDGKIRELKTELDTYKRFEEWVAEWCDDRLPNRDHTKDVSLREQLNAVWDKATEQLEAAEKACAEMRDALERVVHAGAAYGVIPFSTLSAVNNALGYDCGKNYVSLESVMPLVDFIRRIGGENHNLECPNCPQCRLVEEALALAKQLGLGGEK